MVFTNIPGGNRITKGIIIAEGKTINTQMKGGENMHEEIEPVGNIHPVICMRRIINLLAHSAETADTTTLLTIASVMTEMYKAIADIAE